MPQAKSSRFAEVLPRIWIAAIVFRGVNATRGMASKSEVEFVFSNKSGKVVPIEVKSGKNTGAKSVRSFAEKYDIPYTLKPSMKNFGSGNGVRSIPLYAVFCIE